MCYIFFLTNFYILYTALTMITSYLYKRWTAIWWFSQAFILNLFSIWSPRICFKKFFTSPNCLMTLSFVFKRFSTKKKSYVAQSISRWKFDNTVFLNLELQCKVLCLDSYSKALSLGLAKWDIWGLAHCALLFFFKFVSRANNSKSCPPTKWPSTLVV